MGTGHGSLARSRLPGTVCVFSDHSVDWRGRLINPLRGDSCESFGNWGVMLVVWEMWDRMGGSWQLGMSVHLDIVLPWSTFEVKKVYGKWLGGCYFPGRRGINSFDWNFYLLYYRMTVTHRVSWNDHVLLNVDLLPIFLVERSSPRLKSFHRNFYAVFGPKTRHKFFNCLLCRFLHLVFVQNAVLFIAYISTVKISIHLTYLLFMEISQQGYKRASKNLATELSHQPN